MYHTSRWRARAAMTLDALLSSSLASIAQTPADNTKVNTRDRAKGAVTADQQKENAADRELAKKIRAAITDDDTLSTYAHNVKVIVRDGKVTLKGPVRTAAEKTAVAAKATEIAGKDHVTNSLSVAPDHDKTPVKDTAKEKPKTN